jgi:hypothetical protein
LWFFLPFAIFGAQAKIDKLRPRWRCHPC